jgi:isochorismate pyruvate lyase
MRSPSECRDLSEIREEVDRIDRALIDLLGRRWEYGCAAVRFKASEADIRSPAYLPVFLERRRAWAEAASLAPGYVEAVFRTIAEASMAEQLRRWRPEHAAGSE